MDTQGGYTPDTELLTTTSNNSINLKSDIKHNNGPGVSGVYVLVMILAIRGIRDFVRRKSQKLSNSTLHEQENNDYEHSSKK